MKKILSLAVCIAIVLLCQGLVYPGTGSAETSAAWETDLDRAIAIATQKNLEILLVFTGLEWCPYCQKLEREVFSRQEFADLARDKLVLVKIDYPADRSKWTATHRSLLVKYLVDEFPAAVVLTGEGKMIVGLHGYIAGGSMVYMQTIEREVERIKSLSD